jgi:hypothetical protein
MAQRLDTDMMVVPEGFSGTPEDLSSVTFLSMADFRARSDFQIS